MVQFVYPDGDGNVRALFGVFDGHSTKAAAQFSSAELPGFIERRLRVLDVQERKLRTVDAPSGSFAKFFTERAKLVKEALAAAFLDADRFFLSESVVLHLINGGQRQSLERCFSGACALVALIDRDTLYIANAGDCRAVMGVEVKVEGDEENFDTFLHYPDGTKTAIIAAVLSNDHNTDNHREIARIRAEKPLEIDLFVSGRLKGILKPTRHIGGALMKEPIAKRFIRNDSLTEDWNPPYTTATPEVTHRTLSASDRFIIMGSDGLWDLLSPQEAVSLVVEYDHLKREKTIPVELNVCTFIIERALSRASLSLEAYMPTNTSTEPQPSSSQLNEQNGDSKSLDETFETSGEISSQNGNNGNSTQVSQNGNSHRNLESITNSSLPSEAMDSSVRDTLNASKDGEEKSAELSELERLCTILNLPAHQRRDVYDDISVTVVYLDSGRREQAGTAMGQLANWPCPSFPSSVDRIAKLRKALPLAKGPLGRLLATNTSEAKDIKQYLEECWPDRHLDRWTAQSLTTRKFLKSFGIELAPSNAPLHPSAAKQHQLRDSSFDLPPLDPSNSNDGELCGSDSSGDDAAQREHIESPKPSKASSSNLLQLPVSASHFASSSAGSVASSSASSLVPTPASSTSTSASTTPISSISLMDMGPRS